jgi:hypothetical protein
VKQDWEQVIASISSVQTPITAVSPVDIAPGGDCTYQPNPVPMYVGQKFLISAIGVLSSTSGSNTFAFGVQMGATVINASFGSITLLPSLTDVKWELELLVECRTIGGGTGTSFLCQGHFNCPAAVSVLNMLPASGAAAVGNGVDYTQAQVLRLMGNFNQPGNSLTVEQYHVAWLN